MHRLQLDYSHSRNELCAYRSCASTRRRGILSTVVDVRRMSFFGFEQNNDLENEKRRLLEGGLSGAKQEDVAVYTWGEESYDGLGDALQEGGDELNDETFGAAEDIGASPLQSSPAPTATLRLQGRTSTSPVLPCPSTRGPLRISPPNRPREAPHSSNPLNPLREHHISNPVR